MLFRWHGGSVRVAPVLSAGWRRGQFVHLCRYFVIKHLARNKLENRNSLITLRCISVAIGDEHSAFWIKVRKRVAESGAQAFHD